VGFAFDEEDVLKKRKGLILPCRCFERLKEELGKKRVKIREDEDK